MFRHFNFFLKFHFFNLNYFHVAVNCQHVYACIFNFDRNSDCHTPLDVAALNGHAKVVELLMKTISKCHPDNFLYELVNPSKKFDSPLHLAITQGHLEVVQVLVKRKVKVNFKNCESGKTPLQVAVENKHE